MSGEIDIFAWPAASVLVQRAEQSLKIVRPLPPTTLAASSLTDMHIRLAKLEHGYHLLVPPGYESGGRMASLKRAMKKIARPLMWWYVEPRWIVQRDLTADLASFVSSSIRATDEMVAELRVLRSKVHELEQKLAEQTS